MAIKKRYPLGVAPLRAVDDEVAAQLHRIERRLDELAAKERMPT